MEGVAGISRDEQTDPSSPLHEASRHLMTQEVNAAVEGALEAGVQEVVVSDGHWTRGPSWSAATRAGSTWRAAWGPGSTRRSSSATTRPPGRPTPSSTTPTPT